MILKDILGPTAKIYNIYTDSTPRYAGGSSGLTFYKGKLILAIRQSTNIAMGGTPHYNYRFIHDHTIPYMNNSLCMMGSIDPKDLNDELIYIRTESLNVSKNDDNVIFRGLEDARLIVWENELYVYGTQFTNDCTSGCDMMCYKLNNDLKVMDSCRLPGKYTLGIGGLVTEKNWMAIPDRKMDFIYGIVNKNGNDIPIIYDNMSPDVELNMTVKGSTPLLKDDIGYSCIVHKSRREGNMLYYDHMICYMTDQFEIHGYSKPFHFEQQGIEFCTGWTEDDSGNLYITYSTTDGTTNLLVTDMKTLLKTIEREEGIPTGPHPQEIAEKLFLSNPIDSAQYFWKDWVQNGNRDSLYSHYAILLYYLDRYLLDDTIPELEQDNSVDALVLKIYHNRRIDGNISEFNNMMSQLPIGWKSKIQNKYLIKFNFQKLI